MRNLQSWTKKGNQSSDATAYDRIRPYAIACDGSQSFQRQACNRNTERDKLFQMADDRFTKTEEKKGENQMDSKEMEIRKEPETREIPDKEAYISRISELPAEDQAFLDGYLFAVVKEAAKKGA